MAIAFRAVGTVSTTLSTGGNIGPVALPTGHASGDVLLLVIVQNDNVVATVSGYTSGIATNSGANTRVSVFWKYDGGSESNPTVTRAAGKNAAAFIVAYSGAPSGANPLRDIQSTAGTGTAAGNFNVTAPALTGVVANDLLVFVGGWVSNADTSGLASANWTPPTSFTERLDNNYVADVSAVSSSSNDLLATGSAGSLTSVSTWAGATAPLWVGVQLALSSGTASSASPALTLGRVGDPPWQWQQLTGADPVTVDRVISRTYRTTVPVSRLAPTGQWLAGFLENTPRIVAKRINNFPAQPLRKAATNDIEVLRQRLDTEAVERRVAKRTVLAPMRVAGKPTVALARPIWLHAPVVVPDRVTPRVAASRVPMRPPGAPTVVARLQRTRLDTEAKERRTKSRVVALIPTSIKAPTATVKALRQRLDTEAKERRVATRTMVAPTKLASKPTVTTPRPASVWQHASVVPVVDRVQSRTRIIAIPAAKMLPTGSIAGGGVLEDSARLLTKRINNLAPMRVAGKPTVALARPIWLWGSPDRITNRAHIIRVPTGKLVVPKGRKTAGILEGNAVYPDRVTNRAHIVRVPTAKLAVPTITTPRPASIWLHAPVIPNRAQSRAHVVRVPTAKLVPTVQSLTGILEGNAVPVTTGLSLIVTMRYIPQAFAPPRVTTQRPSIWMHAPVVPVVDRVTNRAHVVKVPQRRVLPAVTTPRPSIWLHAPIVPVVDRVQSRARVVKVPLGRVLPTVVTPRPAIWLHAPIVVDRVQSRAHIIRVPSAKALVAGSIFGAGILEGNAVYPDRVTPRSNVARIRPALATPPPRLVLHPRPVHLPEDNGLVISTEIKWIPQSLPAPRLRTGRLPVWAQPLPPPVNTDRVTPRGTARYCPYRRPPVRTLYRSISYPARISAGGPFFFSPPTSAEGPRKLAEEGRRLQGVSRSGNNLAGYFGSGLTAPSVLKISGVYQTIEGPTDLQVASASEYYAGGHIHPVSYSTAVALAAAGFTVEGL